MRKVPKCRHGIDSVVGKEEVNRSLPIWTSIESAIQRLFRIVQGCGRRQGTCRTSGLGGAGTQACACSTSTFLSPVRVYTVTFKYCCTRKGVEDRGRGSPNAHETEHRASHKLEFRSSALPEQIDHSLSLSYNHALSRCFVSDSAKSLDNARHCQDGWFCVGTTLRRYSRGSCRCRYRRPTPKRSLLRQMNRCPTDARERSVSQVAMLTVQRTKCRLGGS